MAYISLHLNEIASAFQERPDQGSFSPKFFRNTRMCSPYSLTEEFDEARILYATRIITRESEPQCRSLERFIEPIRMRLLTNHHADPLQLEHAQMPQAAPHAPIIP